MRQRAAPRHLLKTIEYPDSGVLRMPEDEVAFLAGGDNDGTTAPTQQELPPVNASRCPLDLSKEGTALQEALVAR
eukprot:5350382-Pyramimonas_sp.AAC.1